MSRYPGYAKNILTITAAVLALTWPASISAAAEISMEDFRAKFQKATGKTWESADHKEKRKFVRTHIKATSPKARSGTAGTSVSKAADRSSNLKRTVNVDVRKKFLARYQKDWNDGTPEEQEILLQEYKDQVARDAQSDEQRISAEKKRLEEIQQQRQQDLEAAQRRKEEETRLKEERARLLQEQRDAEKRKLAEQMEKMRAKQEQIKMKREQSLR